MAKIIQHIDIPDNIAKYIAEHNGVNLNINVNSTDADYEYAHIIWYTVTLSKLTRTCHRCGYDPVWNPDDSNSKCLRHTYNNWRYDTVFAWGHMGNSSLSLEEAFNAWLRSQPASEYQPTKKMIFGQVGFK